MFNKPNLIKQLSSKYQYKKCIILTIVASARIVLMTHPIIIKFCDRQKWCSREWCAWLTYSFAFARNYDVVCDFCWWLVCRLDSWQLHNAHPLDHIITCIELSFHWSHSLAWFVAVAVDVVDIIHRLYRFTWRKKPSVCAYIIHCVLCWNLNDTRTPPMQPQPSQPGQYANLQLHTTRLINASSHPAEPPSLRACKSAEARDANGRKKIILRIIGLTLGALNTFT